ncbi:hypothetical protein FB451DRAFT_1387286 [Mycena latifolia]|nr:hypothetical protein FB451DRAFT_1387286 [Mycena latifolia]
MHDPPHAPPRTVDVDDKHLEPSAALHCLFHPSEYFPASEGESKGPRGDEYVEHAQIVRHAAD